MEATKENLYTVIKNKDLSESLTETERNIFNLLINKATANKPFRKYYVVNKDEPYSHKILEVILDGEESKGPSYKEKLLNLLKENLQHGAEYSESISEGLNKIDFNFTSYPLLGNLDSEIQPAIGQILQKFQILNVNKWRLGNVERFRDTYSFQDVYIGEIIIEQQQGKNSLEL